MPREPAGATTLTVQGTEVPKIGLGTWQLTGGECVEAVRDALELGYRHIDTARAYGNEREVGRGLAAAGVSRDGLWITTKLWYEQLDRDGVRRQVDRSLEQLGCGHLDLLLIHWPSPDVPLAETLAAMRDAQDQGLVRHLGVSNFPAALLAEALEEAPILTDQVEYHPLLAQPELLRLCRERDVMLTAYSPLAQGRAVREPVIEEIAQAQGVTAGQVVLRWLLDQPQVSALPRSSSPERRAENLDVFSFELTDEQRGRIAGLARDDGRGLDPPWAPDWD